jgi:hypothetical protein
MLWKRSIDYQLEKPKEVQQCMAATFLTMNLGLQSPSWQPLSFGMVKGLYIFVCQTVLC